jgi:hypothetical protein
MPATAASQQQVLALQQQVRQRIDEVQQRQTEQLRKMGIWR